MILSPLTGEGGVAIHSAKLLDRRKLAGLIDFVTTCHDAQMVGPYRLSNQPRLTVLIAKSEDYATVPPNFQVPLVILAMKL